MVAVWLVGNLDAGERRVLQIIDGDRLRIAAVAEQSDVLQKEASAAEAACMRQLHTSRRPWIWLTA